MYTYTLGNSDGQSLKFRGDLIASVKSQHLMTLRGDVWFQLTAYATDHQQFIATIAIKSAAAASDEVCCFYTTPYLSAAEDFLYDFEPMAILPDDLVANRLPASQSIASVADQSYYAAVRQLIRDMVAFEVQRNTALDPPLVTTIEHSEVGENMIVNRIKQWFRN